MYSVYIVYFWGIFRPLYTLYTGANYHFHQSIPPFGFIIPSVFFNVNAFVYFSAINDQGIFLINKEKTFVELKFTAVRDGSLLVITKSHAISDYKEQDYI